MKAKKRILKLCLILKCISLLGIFVFCQEQLLYDISVALFGGVVLALLISCIEYSIERRKAMEIYIEEADKILRLVRRIPFYDCKRSTRIVAEIIARRGLDDSFDLGDPQLGISLPCTLRSCFRTNPQPPVNPPKYESSYIKPSETLSGIMEIDLTNMDNCCDYNLKAHMHLLENAFDGWINVAEHDYRYFDRAYSNLDFLFANTTIRNVAFLAIQDKIQKLRKQAINFAYHANLTKEGKGNHAVCHLILIKNMNKLVYIKEYQHGYICYYNFVYDDMNQAIENFYARIYGKKPREIKRQPTLSICSPKE
ncbi:MAG: hypothetical protein FWB88_03285 [Defluviitaleaceae bacterium]|nr:hypothetical protein [Defluviitaleaceae bacterium]MCL2238689.1 hypothetical protein [Defluviitaleaceae bacterium]